MGSRTNTYENSYYSVVVSDPAISETSTDDLLEVNPLPSPPPQNMASSPSSTSAQDDSTPPAGTLTNDETKLSIPPLPRTVPPSSKSPPSPHQDKDMPRDSHVIPCQNNDDSTPPGVIMTNELRTPSIPPLPLKAPASPTSPPPPKDSTTHQYSNMPDDNYLTVVGEDGKTLPSEFFMDEAKRPSLPVPSGDVKYERGASEIYDEIGKPGIPRFSKFLAGVVLVLIIVVICLIIGLCVVASGKNSVSYNSVTKKNCV